MDTETLIEHLFLAAPLNRESVAAVSGLSDILLLTIVDALPDERLGFLAAALPDQKLLFVLHDLSANRLASLMSIEDEGVAAEAFLELHDRYRRQTEGRSGGQLGSANVDDVAQYCWEAIWTARRRFLPGAPFEHWMNRILSHKIKDAVRFLRGPGAKLEPFDEATADMEAGDFLADRDKTERAEVVNHSLARLPPPYQVLLRLRFVKGLTLQEIADQLGLPISEVKIRLLRAKSRFKEYLIEDGYPEKHPQPSPQTEQKSRSADNDRDEGDTHEH